MSDAEDDGGEHDGELIGIRQRRVKAIAWVVIAALVLAGGGATLISLLPL